jgi:hypothetical protein
LEQVHEEQTFRRQAASAASIPQRRGQTRAVTPEDDIIEVIRRGYAAFNARDVDGALAAMTDDVVWANGWEGGHVHGHAEVRDYWTRQWRELDPNVTPLEITVNGDTADVLVDQVVRNADGSEVRAGTVRHRYVVRGGRIARMDIDPDV